MAIYNLTSVENATGIPEAVIAMNTVSNTWIFSSLLVALFLIVLVVIKQLGYDYGTAFFSASISITFLASILLYFGGVGIIMFSISIALSIMAIFIFALGGK